MVQGILDQAGRPTVVFRGHQEEGVGRADGQAKGVDHLVSTRLVQVFAQVGERCEVRERVDGDVLPQH